LRRASARSAKISASNLSTLTAGHTGIAVDVNLEEAPLQNREQAGDAVR
jgi:hypothetical protein